MDGITQQTHHSVLSRKTITLKSFGAVQNTLYIRDKSRK